MQETRQETVSGSAPGMAGKGDLPGGAAKATAAKGRKTGAPRALFLYESLIKGFPVPGGGGAHVALFRAGVLGFKAGIPLETILAEVTAGLPQGTRTVTEEEIHTGVTAGFTTALGEATGVTPPKPKASAPRVPDTMLQRIIRSNPGVSIDDIARKSPVPLDFPQWEAAWRLLDALFLPGECLYIGGAQDPGIFGETVRPVPEWVEILRKSPPTHPHIIANPLTGKAALKKNGKGMSLRADGCVCRFRHLVFEMDNVSLEDQLCFWFGVRLPVRALIMSGGKSIHGWVDVDCQSALEWERDIERDFFPAYLEPLGADPACKNEARVSRLPGYTRPGDDKYPGKMQRLIWLSPEGKAVCEV